MRAKLNGATRQTDVYDGAGMRVEKTETDSAVFSYSGVNLMYEKDITNGAVADYIYGDGMQVAKVTGGVTYYFHEDQVGSNRLVTYLNAGTVTNKFSSDYQPYGTNYGSSGSEVVQYTDRMLDSSDSLYYFNARTYNPSIMRFMSRDPPAGSACPCASSATTNLYWYANDNPLTNTYPTSDRTFSCGWFGCAISFSKGQGDLFSWFLSLLSFGGSFISRIAPDAVAQILAYIGITVSAAVVGWIAFLVGIVFFLIGTLVQWCPYGYWLGQYYWGEGTGGCNPVPWYFGGGGGWW